MTTCGEGGMSMAGVALRKAWKSVELNARWMQNPAGANQTRLDSDRDKIQLDDRCTTFLPRRDIMWDYSCIC